jgi:glutamyl-tRNA reductase
VVEAEAIISNQVSSFLHWVDSREVVPTIRALRDSAESVRQQELENALKALARGSDPAQVLEALSKSITNKLMHPPTQALNAADGHDRNVVAGVLSRIYHLNSDK